MVMATKHFLKNLYQYICIFQEIAFNLVIILGLFAGVNHIIVLTLVFGGLFVFCF